MHCVLPGPILLLHDLQRRGGHRHRQRCCSRPKRRGILSLRLIKVDGKYMQTLNEGPNHHRLPIQGKTPMLQYHPHAIESCVLTSPCIIHCLIVADFCAVPGAGSPAVERLHTPADGQPGTHPPPPFTTILIAHNITPTVMQLMSTMMSLPPRPLS